MKIAPPEAIATCCRPPEATNREGSGGVTISSRPQSRRRRDRIALRGSAAGCARRPQVPCVDGSKMDVEVKMPDLAEVLRNALSLEVHDRAALAERLLASLEELSEEEAERLWAEEAQRRLEEYRAGRAKAVRAEEVHEKAGKLLR